MTCRLIGQDKHCGDEYVSEFEEGAQKMVDYIKAMEREISKRKQVSSTPFQYLPRVPDPVGSGPFFVGSRNSSPYGTYSLFD